MFSYRGSFAMGHHISSPDAIAAGPSAIEDKQQRLSFIEALSMAGKEGMFRRKAKPAVLPARRCTIGFTVSVDRASASGMCSVLPCRVDRSSCVTSACCTESSFGSMAAEGSESSNNEGPAATVDHSVVQEDVMLDNWEEAEGKLGGIA